MYIQKNVILYFRYFRILGKNGIGTSAIHFCVKLFVIKFFFFGIRIYGLIYYVTLYFRLLLFPVTGNVA